MNLVSPQQAKEETKFCDCVVGLGQGLVVKVVQGGKLQWFCMSCADTESVTREKFDR